MGKPIKKESFSEITGPDSSPVKSRMDAKHSTASSLFENGRDRKFLDPDEMSMKSPSTNNCLNTS